jgi:hypothetical protein
MPDGGTWGANGATGADGVCGREGIFGWAMVSRGSVLKKKVGVKAPIQSGQTLPVRVDFVIGGEQMWASKADAQRLQT